MRTILIIEDEAIAAEHLRRLLLSIMPDATVLPPLQSIEESVEYFKAADNPQPDLCFMDIHLADGLAFHIFDEVDIECPLIFTTAYDQYALNAFKAGGIDYLLKPIAAEDLQHAIDKLERLGATVQRADIDALASNLRSYQTHFLIPVHDKLIPVEISQVACFYLEDKVPRAIFYDGHEQTMDRPLDAIMDQLNPDLFFRANRQYIIAQNAVKEINIWPISKLAITLSVETPSRIIVSKARVGEFKRWYTK